MLVPVVVWRRRLRGLFGLESLVLKEEALPQARSGTCDLWAHKMGCLGRQETPVECPYPPTASSLPRSCRPVQSDRLRLRQNRLLTLSTLTRTSLISGRQGLGGVASAKGPQRRLRRRRSSHEITKNLSGQDFVDLTVPGHRLGSAGLWLVKDVMATSVAEENTTSLLQFSDQVSSFQATTSSATLRTPGRSSFANS